VIVGFYVVQMAAPEPVQWLALFVAAVAGTFALYEIVRRIGPLRFLFGMRPRKKAPGAIAPGAGASGNEPGGRLARRRVGVRRPARTFGWARSRGGAGGVARRGARSLVTIRIV
jgi:hypothetical protein